MTTAWLLCDNGLPAFCADFPTSSSLCIQNRYALYTVKANDTCLGIASSRSLAQVQLTTCKYTSIAWCLLGYVPLTPREPDSRQPVPLREQLHR